ncbi:thioesterase family protein [Salimicrobium halophilum]|uniref:Acyl-CoA thioester hydrolase n=1 Tax=Salimicrobium halophilum TaxID=86666 RepID=A0A1G8UAG9_9BACI|nr:thioesterase family protein [Salimicrobium halophilum]SDJ50604.1 acyl-CoA thioester hydrolase [Salimicrobium halophilum]
MTIFRYNTTVHRDWVDYNGHMNDAAYAAVFSEAVDAWMGFIGLDEKHRQELSYTIFTLETHLCYLQEAHEEDPIHVSIQVLDVDHKRIHAFFSMKNSEEETIATSEQMLMGMNTETNRPDAFPSTIQETLDKIYKEHTYLDKPIQTGRVIGISRN